MFQVTGQQSMSPGPHTLTMSFAYDGQGKRGAGGKATLLIDGKKAGEGRIEKTHANTFSLDDTADTGVDTGTPVDEDYGEGLQNTFNGTLKKVTIEVK
jgi:arylsulfatase